MALKSKQISYLRGLAHQLKPVVQLGKNGYTEALVQDVARNLKSHELIKVRISVEEREQFLTLTESLAEDTKSTLVQTIGRTAVLYRPSEKPRIELPH